LGCYTEQPERSGCVKEHSGQFEEEM